MAIYTRDNLAASITPGLASALDRAAAYRARQNARIADSFKAVTDFAPVLGRTIEQGFTPDKYKDDKDYRAARYDYILNGDRSGLDRIKQAEQQAAESEKQRAFQAQEAALNRALQASEGDKNRAIQQQQHGFAKITEKAKMLRDINDADSLVLDIEKHPEKYGGENAAQLPLAKAKHARDLALNMASDSGLFTGTELKPYQNIKTPNTPVADDNTPAAPAEPEAPKADWTDNKDTVSRLYDNAKTLEDIKAADEQFAALGKPETDNKAYQELVAKKDKATERVKNSIADVARHETLAKNVKDSALATAVLEGKTSYTGPVDGKDVTFDIKRDDMSGKYILVYKGKVYKTFDPYQ